MVDRYTSVHWVSCGCLNSLRIRVEAHADTTERTVIRQQCSHALLKSLAQMILAALQEPQLSILIALF